MARPMRLFAKWHIWLGWLTGVPLLLWCASGLVMVAKPIEEVRGNDLRIERPPERISGNPYPIFSEIDQPDRMPVKLVTTVERGAMITRATYPDGHVERYAGNGEGLPAVDEQEARAVVAHGIRGGNRVESVELFDAAHAPLDFRKRVAAWRVTLADGTYVYVGRDSGEIEAVRTRWWRFYDVFWGLHIMDLQTREDTHHPLLILFAALALLGSIFGTVLLFRRRKARPKVA